MDRTPAEVRVGFTAGTSRLGRAIRWADYARNEYGRKVPSLVNHVLLHFLWSEGPDYIHESQGGGVESSPFSHVQRALDSGRVLRLVEVVLDLDEDERRRVYERACQFHATGYDWKALALYMVWARIKGKAKDDSLRRDDPERLTCNQFVAGSIGGIVRYVHGAPDHPEQIRLTPETFFSLMLGQPSPRYLRGREDHKHIIERAPPLVP